MSLEFVAHFAGLSHSICNFERERSYEAVAGCHFGNRRSCLSPPPQILFRGPLVGGASVMAPQCYRWSLLNGDLDFDLLYVKDSLSFHGFVRRSVCFVCFVSVWFSF